MNETAEVRLAPFAECHLEKTLLWVNESENMRLLHRMKTVSAEEHRAWFDDLRHRTDRLYFAILDDDDRHVGNVWLWDVDRRNHKAEVRILVGEPDARNQGVGSAALRLLAEHAQERLRLHRLYAYVLAINQRGAAAFCKACFAQEGTLRDDRFVDGAYVDALLFARILEPTKEIG